MKYFMCFLLPVLLLLFAGAKTSEAGEVESLISFKNSLPDPRHLQGWSTNSYSPCGFPGVGCNVAGNVSSILLEGLTADFRAVAAYLLPLPSLQRLALRSGNITGTLATLGVAKCGARLAEIDLSGNGGLGGAIADVAALAGSCNGLRFLNLSGNAIGDGGSSKSSASSVDFGAIEILDLSYNKISADHDLRLLLSYIGKVRFLDLTANRFAGSVPPVANCTSLIHLDLSSNYLSGEITNGVLSDCKSLSYLNLSSNHLTGVPPGDLSSCTSLTVLSLANNNFSGDFPFHALSAMANLRVLELAYNELNGSVPNSISELSALEVFDLSSNYFFGTIPSPLCQSPSNLKELYLQDNYFSGAIPESISNCSNLTSLDLSLNYLNGSIPAALGSLSSLKDLLMWQNSLQGEIPSELGNIKALENLVLDYNGLTGNIPSGLANCTNLNWISLASNQLSGTIPPWIGRLGNLFILKLGNNSFSGPIPPELGDCKSLVWLDLNSNKLNSSIPPELAKQSGKIEVGLLGAKRYVYLRHDPIDRCPGAGSLLEFRGIRLDDINRLPSKQVCNFTWVYIGNTQATFNHNGSMMFLDLSYNQLSGGIPQEISSMFYLTILNLGHNMLSGLIPPELGQLAHVYVLDLSHNEFEGPIPTSFSTLSLSEVDLSNNKLNGSIPQLGSLPTFPRSQYENNSGLCGFPLPLCGSNSSSNGNANREKARRRQASLAGSVAMGLLFALFVAFGLIIIAVESRKRRKKNAESNNHPRDIYIDSLSNSGTVNSNWKLSGTNAFSINLATFEKPLQKLTLGDLVEATNGFHDDSLIGSGGFGDVYKAQLKDGRVVAIKKLIHISGQGDREFTAEMETIGKIKHRNLVPLLGYCKVGEERLLVYDFMKYGSLDDVLHDRKKIGIKLNWEMRRKIAVGAARGLAFLHHNCIPHIIHRDMKSSNVLLDEHFEARVSDFGMARFMSAMDTHLSVSTLAGTPGYVPPEYYQSFRCTTKGDVYSYGVVLLELLTGRPSTDASDFGDNNLVGWVKQHTKLTITDVFDPFLLKDDPSVELELLEHLKVACACLDDRPSKRPTMLKVMALFKEIQAGPFADSRSSGPAASEGSLCVEMNSLAESREEKD